MRKIRVACGGARRSTNTGSRSRRGKRPRSGRARRSRAMKTGCGKAPIA
jgi:hypothetical protein